MRHTKYKLSISGSGSKSDILFLWLSNFSLRLFEESSKNYQFENNETTEKEIKSISLL